LTTSPAMRFGYSSHSGRIARGMDADLVVLDGDAARDVTAFSKVHQVIRGGKLSYPARARFRLNSALAALSLAIPDATRNDKHASRVEAVHAAPSRSD
jgi:N-acyl-D-aspartate/D-glutamate deacylase